MRRVQRRRSWPLLIVMMLASSLVLVQMPTMLHTTTDTPVVAAQETCTTTITVNTTDDSDTHPSHTCDTTPNAGQTAFPGECTLRRAIVEASSLDDTARPVCIAFDIPESDPGYDADQGIWRIVVNNTYETAAYLPPIGGGEVIIDGTTQPGGRDAADGPNVFITANNHETVATSLRLRLGEISGDDSYVVRGLGLQGLGISMVGSNNLVEDNWLGLTDDGTKIWFYRADNPLFVQRTRNASGELVVTPVVNPAYTFEGHPDNGSGAVIEDAKAGNNNIFRNNVLAGSRTVAFDLNSTGSEVSGNFIGTRADGTVPAVPEHRTCQPNALYYNWFGGGGINLSSDATNIMVKDNTIAGLLWHSSDVYNTPPHAITVRGNDNTVENNQIGVDAQGNEVGTCWIGLDMGGHNQTIRNNTLVDTRGGAFGIYGTPQTLDAIHLSGNTAKDTYLGHNLTLPTNPHFGSRDLNVYKQFNSAAVTSIDGTTVRGTAGADSPCAGCTVELYADDTDPYIEALELLGTATAGSDGTWETTISRELEEGEALRTASTTARDEQISGIDAPTTAKFSVLYSPTGIITPTGAVSPTVTIAEPPAFPALQPREVPPLPTRAYTIELTVNTTADHGDDKSSVCTGNTECTLRYAINEANKTRIDDGSRPLLIGFDIPESDDGYDAGTGTWTIEMNRRENTRVEGGLVTIDGTTQPGGRDTGPKIIVRDTSSSPRDFVMDGSDTIVRGMGFQGTGLTINGSNNFVEDNWFGLTNDGQDIYYRGDDPTRDNHAWLQDGTESSVGTPAIENVYRNNVFAGSISPAITVRGDSSWVVGNRIGTRGDGTVPGTLPSDWCEQGSWYGGAGITVQGKSHQIGGPTEAERNYLVGLNYPTSDTSDPPIAISLSGGGLSGHLVINNVLGADVNGVELGNCGEGIRFAGEFSAAQGNTLIKHGVTAFMQVPPRLGGNRNLMTNNILQGNASAMEYSEALKKELDLAFFNPARVTGINGTTVTGISGNDYVDPITGYVVKGFCPYCTIELFPDTNDDDTIDAMERLTTTTSDADGNWEATLPRELAEGEGIRTTTTSGEYGTVDAEIKWYEVGTTSKLSRLYTANVNDNIVEDTVEPDEIGEVYSYDDQVMVEVPADVVSGTYRLIYTDLDTPTNALPQGSTLYRAFTVVAENTLTMAPIHEFAEPVVFQIRYDEDELADLELSESQLTVRYWDEDAGAWANITSTPTCERCGVSVYQNTNLIYVTIDHLTEFYVGSAGGSEPVYIPLVMR